LAGELARQPQATRRWLFRVSRGMTIEERVRTDFRHAPEQGKPMRICVFGVGAIGG
jgi:hypothetical protein